MSRSSFEASTLARVASALAVLAASVAAVVLLWSGPVADAFFAAWVVGSVIVAGVGAVGAWTNRPPLAWLGALSLTAIVVVGLLSIGIFVAPAALLSLAAAVASQRARSREAARAAVLADPPTGAELAAKAVAGVGSVLVGAVLVYLGAFVRELFARGCLAETLACALAVTNWDAVAFTGLGGLAVVAGAWLVWQQVFVASLLAFAQNG
ncbi:hypothetical protein G9C85_04185 [Halorubellus sp. JP-L1]|uniref:hypothetical protein n=1 Tax=Halorubellus sp. JP-L1 TaxID=2715753 RepID=UPI00140DCB66|nr:hypothetical protein [Halorubellus sp. JP-L1]NHN40832.1 hypothetical protein [Halorubellus sp. JP-L1]